MHTCFSFDETKLTNGKLCGELRQVLSITSKNGTEFSDCPTNMVMWNLKINILRIMGHTDNEKDRLQHPEQQI